LQIKNIEDFDNAVAFEIIKEKVKYQLQNMKYYVTPKYYNKLLDRYFELNLGSEEGKFGYEDYSEFLNYITFDQWQMGEIAEADMNLIAYDDDPIEQQIVWNNLTKRITELQKDKDYDGF